MGCNSNLSTTNLLVVSDFEKVDNLILTNMSENFSYDSTSSQFIYKDFSGDLSNEFAYYAYRVSLVNVAGRLDSAWSIAFLSWQNRPPTPPLDLKISQAHSTGFTIKFKEPLEFNGTIYFNFFRI